MGKHNRYKGLRIRDILLTKKFQTKGSLSNKLFDILQSSLVLKKKKIFRMTIMSDSTIRLLILESTLPDHTEISGNSVIKLIRKPKIQFEIY